MVRLTSFMMTSSNGNIFRVAGHLCGEFTDPGWIPHTKASDAELGCFLINGWVNNGEAGDLRRRRAHYDVTVMSGGFLDGAVFIANLPAGRCDLNQWWLITPSTRGEQA